MAGSGSIDEHEHTGSLFWLVARTPDPAEANLHTETMSFKQNIEIVLSAPAHKKRKLQPSEWAASDLPCLPYLTNQKPLAKHTRLCMFMPEKGQAK